MSLNRVIITTGGTGGHIFPALAVASEIKRRNPDVNILFMGGGGPEGDLARRHGLEFLELPAKGIIGRGIKGKLGGAAWLATAVPKAMLAVRRFDPDVVIGFGGYAGFCPVLAAALLGIPTAVHEQNSVPGVTNKVLGKLVRRVFLSFPDVLNVFPPAKTVLTGNPVRKEIVEAASKRKGRTPGKRILILGGSQGARPINDVIIKALSTFKAAGVTLVHQAGKLDADRVRASYEAAKADTEQVREFIEDMATEYARADLAICRAGASTIFEIAAAGVPAIFVPFPHATHDHQTMNAEAMEEIGAAHIIPQADLMSGELVELSLDLLKDTERLSNMETAARQFAREHAAADIAAGLEALAA